MTKPRTRFGIAVIALALALAGYALFFETNTGVSVSRENAMSNPSEAEIVAFIGAPLPADAEEQHLFRESGIDQIMYVAFFAPPESVEAFLEALGIEEPIREGYNPLRETARDGLPWWTVASMVDPAGVKETRYQPVAKAYEVAIDRVTATSWHIFLRVFEVY